MLCFQLVNYNICCKDTKCAWGNNYFLYWNFDQKNAIFFHRWNECDKIDNSTFSNQNLRIWFFLFQIRWKKKSRYSIEFGKEILDFTKQCALSWNHSLLITLTRDILWRFYVVAVWQILFQFRKKNIYEKDTFFKKIVAAINTSFIFVLFFVENVICIRFSMSSTDFPKGFFLLIIRIIFIFFLKIINFS